MFSALGKIANDYDRVNAAIAARGPVEPSPSRYDAWYADYLKSIERYKGTSFYQELLNNPYASKQDAPLNFFQQLWKDMTGTSAAETNFYNQREQSAAEYMSQILDAHRQEQYNDPAAQLAREKAAGLNPALNGGQNLSAGETGEVAPDDTPPVPAETQDDLQAAGNVMNFGFSLFQNFLSMAGAMQSLQSQSLANDQAELSLTDSGWDQLIKFAVENVSPEFSQVQDWGSLSEEQQNGMIDAELGRLMDHLQSGTFSNMYNRKKLRSLGRRLESLLADSGTDNLAYRKYKNDLVSKVFKSSEEAANAAGKYGFSENILAYGNTLARTFGNIEKEAREAAARLAKSQANRSQIAEGYEGAALTPELGSAENAAGIATAESVQAQQHLDSYIDKQLDGLMKELEGKNDFGSLLLRFLIPSARSIIKSIGASYLNTPKGAKFGVTL